MRRRSEGFSLIEVVIAVAVLAVVAMFLLAYFSSANRYANWGKTTQKADMAAQSVVEELASCSTFDQIRKELIASGSAVSGVKWEEISSDVSSYKMQRDIVVDDTTYIARATLDFDKYKASSSAGPTTTPVSKFNDYQVPRLEKVYSEHNAVLEETDQTVNAAGDLFNQAFKDNSSIGLSDIKSGLERTMYINIRPYDSVLPTADPSSATEDLYLVKAYYEYAYPKPASIGGKYKCVIPVKNVKIEKKALKNIYLFYRPVNGSISEEKLDISASSMPFDFKLSDLSFYVVLQKEAGVAPPTDYKLKIQSNNNPPSPELKKKVYANKIENGGSVSDELIKYDTKDRIAMVTVEIFPENETDFSEGNRLVMVQTSKGV